MRKESYKEAQSRLFVELAKSGWAVKKELVIPHVTSPSGKTRCWFKAQAVHKNVTRVPGEEPNIRGALSMFIDIRGMDAKTFCQEASVPYRG